MTRTAFTLPEPLTLPITEKDETFPVGRIFCVGRNYVAHAKELGNEVDREAPFYFTKSAANAVGSGLTVPFPKGTSDYHHEVELFVALGASLRDAAPAETMAAVMGYGCGLDMTRRDLQTRERKKQRPWDLGKDVENGCVLGAITLRDAWAGPEAQEIWLKVNEVPRQSGKLEDMVWSVPEILSHLSGYYDLRAGDIVMTGTPAGVGPVAPGDTITAGVSGLSEISLSFAQA